MSGSSLSVRMADLARDLEAEHDPLQTLQHIVKSSVDLIEGCDTAGITLAHAKGKVSTSATTHDVHTQLDELQQELGEGPCLDAVWKDMVVLVPDLASDERWPKWRPRAVGEFGVRGMVCLRLFTHGDRVGALNLFSFRTNAFDEDSIEEATAIGAHAATAIAAAEDIGHLQAAIGNRTLIGQATGLVMARYDLTATQGFNVIARLSSEQNRKVSVIAREIVDQWDKDRDL